MLLPLSEGTLKQPLHTARHVMSNHKANPVFRKKLSTLDHQ
jgi:hypothetical protein